LVQIFLLLTHVTTLVDEEKAKATRIAAYIMKSIVKQEMAKTLRKVLDN
jgi:hypothetical protein